ncbi:cytochrome P450 [Mycena capillaripes]|nr:cytochrome P450 [Mycena capillaripes]
MPLALYYVAFAGALCLILILGKGRRASMLPPGPPGDLLIGHLLRIPTMDTAKVFHEWSKTYGDVMCLKVLGRTMIILDSYQAAVDLLDKRGSIYSDRPKLTLYELLGWNPSITLLPYGKQWNKQRAMHQSYLSRNKVEDFKLIQALEAQTLVRNLIETTSDKYQKCMARFATGIITQIVAGHRISSDDDPYPRISDMIVETFYKAGPPGNSPVDFFPILQHFPPWFPGASHVGVARASRPILREIYDYPTWGALSVFVLAMTLHPECQLKAQKEIDFVVGGLRLPDFEDRENLPFVEFILQETFRWKNGLPLGVPHRVMEVDVYRGMLIPKGSMILPNIRAMSLDESVYSDPTSFYPERFFPKPAGRGEPYFNNVIFGFGRRVCTGQYVAENSLWIAISTILASCQIANALDEKGNIIASLPMGL